MPLLFEWVYIGDFFDDRIVAVDAIAYLNNADIIIFFSFVNDNGETRTVRISHISGLSKQQIHFTSTLNSAR